MSVGVLVFEDETTASVRSPELPDLVVIGGTTPASALKVVIGGPKGNPGDKGDPGDALVQAFTHTQAIASTIWLVEYGLDYEPGGWLVMDDAGVQHFPVITFPSAGVAQLAFVVAVAGTARSS